MEKGCGERPENRRLRRGRAMDQCFHPLQKDIEDWHFWYAVRRDLLDLFAQQGLQGRRRAATSLAPPRILDIGCGTGGNSLALARHGEVIGFDVSDRAFRISMDRPYRHRVVGSAERLPFADRCFDLVSALDVLEHLDDDLAAASELHRVLTPSGAAVVFVPAFQALWGQNDVMSHHRRRYTKETLSRVLTAAGFDLEYLGYFNLLLFLPTLLVRKLERFMPGTAQRLEYQERPSLLNSLLTAVFRAEIPVLKRASLPLGTSVCCLARKRA